VMDERIRFVTRVKDGESMASSMDPISLPFQTLQRTHAYARFSGVERPPCFREMT